MKQQFVIFLLVLSTPAITHGQVAISGDDMFNQTNLYYRAYANNYDPSDISGGTAYTVPTGLIGAEGPDQFWDFSTGPTNRVFRFDYVSPTGLSQAADFPQAKIAEQMTDETNGAQQWLFFEQVPSVGRTVYGFYAANPLFTPSNVFVPPIVDFPDQITYGKQWNTSTTYENTLNVGGTDVQEQVTENSDFKVDAYGTILLPKEIGAFGQGLRISEAVTIDISVDLGLGDGFEHQDTEYVQNYYWLMPGRGIVAQLNSTQNTSPPGPNFTRATAFLRQFETNKKPSTTGGGCTDPQPVTDLLIHLTGNNILLTWTKADCATQYRIEYASDPSNGASWTALGNATTNAFWQGETTGNPTRFYRIVSLP